MKPYSNNPAELARLVRRFRGKRIAVAGDFMLDRFLRGEVTRVSPEAPVPLVHISADGEEVRPGGAGNVVANLAALGARPVPFGVVGADAEGRRLQAELKPLLPRGSSLLEDRGRPTTVKTRIIARHHHVVRVDREEARPLGARLRKQMVQRLKKQLPGLDALVLSDYDKGVLGEEWLEEVLPEAARAGIPVFLDMKVERRWPGTLELVQMNRHRAEELTQRTVQTERNLDIVGRALQARFPCRLLALTLGAEGMRIFEREGHTTLQAVRQKPWEVFDVTGAGDTVLCALALSLLSGATAAQAARLANLAAGVVVGKLGTAVCSRRELLAELAPAARRAGTRG